MIDTIDTIKPADDITIWQVVGGKITQVKIQDGIFIVRSDADIDPIKAAKDFLRVFDIGKTNVIRKVTGNVSDTSTKSEAVKAAKKKRPRTFETGEHVGMIVNIPIIKERLTGFYRKYPRAFTTKNMKNYFMEVYKVPETPGGLTPSDSTVLNKQRAHLKFLVNKGYVKQISGKGNYNRVYEWKEAPYGAEPAAQAEKIDTKYLIDLTQRERNVAMDR